MHALLRGVGCCFERACIHLLARFKNSGNSCQPKTSWSPQSTSDSWNATSRRISQFLPRTQSPSCGSSLYGKALKSFPAPSAWQLRGSQPLEVDWQMFGPLPFPAPAWLLYSRLGAISLGYEQPKTHQEGSTKKPVRSTLASS